MDLVRNFDLKARKIHDPAQKEATITEFKLLCTAELPWHYINQFSGSRRVVDFSNQLRTECTWRVWDSNKKTASVPTDNDMAANSV